MFWRYVFLLGVLVSRLLLGPSNSWGQCPPVVGCTPGNAPSANVAVGMGIFRVQVAGLDTTTNGAVDGYRDYSCRSRARLVRGTSYTLTVTTNANVDERVGAWVDWNGNGILDATTERVLTSLGRVHTGIVVVPGTVAVGTPLRLRIAADYVNAPVPGPCTTPLYSQTEDYELLVVAGSLPRPVPSFIAIDTVSCTGNVAFRDSSRNAPTHWRWRFGDGNASTQQHPTHAYAQPGTYSVTLRACNAAGCDSLTKTAYVVVRNDGPRAAPCQPATAAYCCQFGLTRVRLAGLDHAPGTGAAGYQDASCQHRAILTVDRVDTLRLGTGQAAAQDIRVYLDLNDDGQFNPSSEKLYAGLGVSNPIIPLVVPSTTSGLVYHRALRLRVCADYAGSTAVGPCTAPREGQVVDYSVVLQTSTVAPQAAFSVNYTQLCGPVVATVTNTSAGATSYTWDWGDGSTASGASPPPHSYAVGNVYTVRLVARNAIGADTTYQTVPVASNCPTYCPADGGGNSAHNELYFSRVQVGPLDNADVRSAVYGYHDFTSTVVPLTQGQTYTLRTESPPWGAPGTTPWVQVSMWIDYNQDGNFLSDERTGPIISFSPHQASFQIPYSARPGATRIRVQLTRNDLYMDHYTSCPTSGQAAFTEDYTAMIYPASAPPQAGFTVDQAQACNGTVQLRDTSWLAPTEWHWTFGDGGTSAVQNPQHSYTQVGTYTIGLSVRNPYGSSTVSRAAAVTVGQLTQGPRPAACQPPLMGTDGPGYTDTYYAGTVDLLQFGNWSYPNVAPNRFTGYKDETCLSPVALTAGSAVPFLAHMLSNVSDRFKIWLDSNDDGVFDPSGELLYITPISTVVANPHVGTLTAPLTAVHNRPLRMRVWWMASNNYQIVWVDGDPCFRSQQWGQVRDFAAVVTGPVASTTPARGLGSWRVYPSPTTGQLFLETTYDTTGRVQVQDALGRVVHSQSVHMTAGQQQRLALPPLRAGVYFVRLADTGAIQKVVVY